MLIFVHGGLLHAMAAEVGNEDRHIPCKGKVLLFVELGLCSKLFSRVAKGTPFASPPIRCYPGLLGSLPAEFFPLLLGFAGRVPLNSVRFAIVCVCGCLSPSAAEDRSAIRRETRLDKSSSRFCAFVLSLSLSTLGDCERIRLA